MAKAQSLFAALALFIFAASSQAAIRTYKFDLDGSQETPPVVTSATGSCAVTLDDSANTVTVSCTYSGLSSNANNAHIHAGAVGVSGSPIVTLAFTPSTSGTASVTNAPLSGANVAAMIAGNTYVNIHSVNHSGGEIRGQIVGLVPAASTWGLMVMGILLVSCGTMVARHKLRAA